MKFVKPLSEAETMTLEELFRNHGDHRTRIRAHGILLSSKGFIIADISKFYEVNRDSTSRWLDSWESEGLVGLFDDKRSGRPPKSRRYAKAGCASNLSLLINIGHSISIKHPV